jgi:hypothetical protein
MARHWVLTGTVLLALLPPLTPLAYGYQELTVADGGKICI